MSILDSIKAGIKRSRYLSLLHPTRRFHAYCLGAPKTGTTSIASMLQGHYRAEHEPLTAGTMEWVRACHEGSRSPSEFRSYLDRRDRELRLDMESSHPMTVFAGMLAESFPDAKFILVYRDPRAWLESIIDMRVFRAVHRFEARSPTPQGQFFRDLNDIYFRRSYPNHPPTEQHLAEAGLFTLDGYLSGWARYHRQVLDGVPAGRLLVLPITMISARPAVVARFLEIPEATINTARSHTNRAVGRRHILEGLEPGYVGDKIELHCGPIQYELLSRMRLLEDGPLAGADRAE